MRGREAALQSVKISQRQGRSPSPDLSPASGGEEKQPLHARVTKVSLSITHWPTDFFQTAR